MLWPDTLLLPYCLINIAQEQEDGFVLIYQKENCRWKKSLVNKPARARGEQRDKGRERERV
jgi:hypothetical protein